VRKLFIVILAVLGINSYAQQLPAVTVASFDVQGGITRDEANVVYELFVAELVNTRKVRVSDRVNLNAILTEMRFQTSDWSSPEKTASLGRVINSEIIIRGRLMKMGNYIYWTATMLDLRTAKVMYATQDRLNDMGQVWNRLPDFCRRLVEKINQPTVSPSLLTNMAVATFEVQGGVTPEEAGVVTELFIASLVNTGRVNVIDRTNFEKILEEMRFQTSDWSSPNKTAELGRVINVQNIIRGQLMKSGNTIFWVATVLDVNTAQILSSSRQQINNINDIWGNLSNFSSQIISQLPPPNYFLGRWEYNFSSWDTSASREKNHYARRVRNRPTESAVIILNIQNDGTIIIERFDTIKLTRDDRLDFFRTLESSTWAREEILNYEYDYLYKNGSGTGRFNNITRKGDVLVMDMTINIRGLISGIPNSQNIVATLNLSNPNNFSISGLNNMYFILKEDGRTIRQEARLIFSYNSSSSNSAFFRRIN
jgi:TolB-like protein